MDETYVVSLRDVFAYIYSCTRVYDNCDAVAHHVVSLLIVSVSEKEEAERLVGSYMQNAVDYLTETGIDPDQSHWIAKHAIGMILDKLNEVISVYDTIKWKTPITFTPRGTHNVLVTVPT